MTEQSIVNSTNLNEIFSTPQPPSCQPVFRKDLILYIVVVGIEILTNILVLWAIITNRKKLRQNFVYSYVASLVFANIVLGLNTFITLLSFLVPFERPIHDFSTHKYNKDDLFHVQIMNWWAFRKALTVGLFLVMSGSVVALINGIIQSASFVGRAASTITKQRKTSLSKTEQTFNAWTLSRRQTAVLTIFAVWLIPLVYTLLTYAWSGCINYCQCLPAYYSKEHFCSTDTGSDANKCSNVWVPLSNIYIQVGVVMWILQSIAIFVFLGKAINKYKETKKPAETGSVPPSRVPPQSNRDINENHKSIPDQTNQIDEEKNEKQSDVTKIDRTKALTRTSFKKRMHPTIKLLIALSVSYTICTAPIMTCLLIDSISVNRLVIDDITITVSSMTIFVYAFVCPAFLVAYMPGLRNSLIKLLLPCSCTTTTVVNRMARLATVRRK